MEIRRLERNLFKKFTETKPLYGKELMKKFRTI